MGGQYDVSLWVSPVASVSCFVLRFFGHVCHGCVEEAVLIITLPIYRGGFCGFWGASGTAKLVSLSTNQFEVAMRLFGNSL